MVSGIFHQGSGIGNQLHRYIATRVLALDKGYDFGMVNPHLFKAHFIDIDVGKPVFEEMKEWHEEKIVNEYGTDVRVYDDKIKDVEDNTIIDGEFQDERYWEHRAEEVREWLKVEPLDVPEDVCVIQFRGGEYIGVKELFLPKEYWDLCIEEMKKINPNMKFEVHTDDILGAKVFFPEYKCIHDPEINWRSIRYAHYLMLSNSSFSILPAWLNENAKKILAPKYWARRNQGFWALPQNNYKKFTYL